MSPFYGFSCIDSCHELIGENWRHSMLADGIPGYENINNRSVISLMKLISLFNFLLWTLA